MKIKPPETCGYCGKMLKENKCLCGAQFYPDILEHGIFRHPEKPTLFRTFGSTAKTLNIITRQWE